MIFGVRLAKRRIVLNDRVCLSKSLLMLIARAQKADELALNEQRLEFVVLVSGSSCRSPIGEFDSLLDMGECIRFHATKFFDIAKLSDGGAHQTKVTGIVSIRNMDSIENGYRFGFGPLAIDPLILKRVQITDR